MGAKGIRQTPFIDETPLIAASCMGLIFTDVVSERKPASLHQISGKGLGRDANTWDMQPESETTRSTNTHP